MRLACTGKAGILPVWVSKLAVFTITLEGERSNACRYEKGVKCADCVQRRSRDDYRASACVDACNSKAGVGLYTVASDVPSDPAVPGTSDVSCDPAEN